MRAFMVYLGPELYDALKKESYHTGFKMSEIVRLALREKLKPTAPKVLLKKKAKK